MRAGLVQVALVVRDYDEAIAWFTRALGFTLIEDTPLTPEKRWVVLDTGGGARLLLAKAASPEQQGAIGNQFGGRVGFFLHVEDFAAAHARLAAAGVGFTAPPREEPYGKVAVFEDLYGNRWDLIEPKR